jgi:tetratricopeptide (TPR) repeat protein
MLSWQQGRNREAVSALERALAIQMTTAGPDSSLVADSRKWLSLVYRDLGELEIAERHAQEALAVARTLFPEGDALIGNSLRSLGRIAEARGDRAGARALYEQSIAAHEGTRLPYGPALAESVRDLALLLREDGEPKQAVSHFERALALRRKVLGERHRDVAESWHDLARGRSVAGDSSGALEAVRTGVNIFRSAPPASRSQLAAALAFHGDLLRLEGRTREALSCLEEAQAIWREAPPVDANDLARLDASLTQTRALLP